MSAIQGSDRSFAFCKSEFKKHYGVASILLCFKRAFIGQVCSIGMEFWGIVDGLLPFLGGKKKTKTRGRLPRGF